MRPRAAAAPLTSRPILLPEAGARGGSRPVLTPAASPRPPAGRTVALQHQALTPDTANYLGGERGLRRRDEKGFETRRLSWTMPGAPARRTGRALRPGSRVGRPALGSGTGAVRRAGVGRGRQRWWEDTGPRLGSSEPHRRHLTRRVTPSRGVSCRPPVAAQPFTPLHHGFLTAHRDCHDPSLGGPSAMRASDRHDTWPSGERTAERASQCQNRPRFRGLGARRGRLASAPWAPGALGG